MNIFYVITTITINNGCKTSFWDTPWLGGGKPIDIVPLIFAVLKRKTLKVNQATMEMIGLGKSV
jgi:hypothetical protein